MHYKDGLGLTGWTKNVIFYFTISMQPFMLQEAQLLQKGCATHYAKLQSHSTSSKEKIFYELNHVTMVHKIHQL